MTTTSSVSDLASDYVRECLGFASSPASKVPALHRVRFSLASCYYDPDADADAIATSERPTREWRRFLEGGGEGGGDDDGSDVVGAEDFVLRDGLIRCLVEGCEDRDDDDDDDGAAEDGDEYGQIIVESSLRCLTYLVGLRSADGEKRRTIIAPIFGRDFATSISADCVVALRRDHDDDDCDVSGGDGDDRRGGIPRAASDLLIALLRPDRPRNEACADAVRESILLPSCSCPAATGMDGKTPLAHYATAARVARILSSSVVAAVEYSVPAMDYPDEEELSMRRETAALGRLQDMRDVMLAIGTVCSTLCLLGEEEDAAAGGDGYDDARRRCGRRILDAIREIHGVAAYAVESQLETLLDEGATPILSRLGAGGDGADRQSAKADDDAAPRDAMEGYDDDDDDDDDYVDDGKEAELGDACALAPLYATIARPPVLLTTLKHLDSNLAAIAEKLNSTDAELWDERLDALIGIECILAGGIASMSSDARYLFVERLRLMPLQSQIADLRSQITNQACRLIVATVYEYRVYVAEDPQLNQMVSQFVETCIPPILALCMSGTRLMSTQGTACLTSIASICGDIGYPRAVPRLCDEILGPKVHKNRKRASVIALTCALRVWDPSSFPKFLDQLTKAVREGATNRDPTVREEGRKLYWAMVACCDETFRAVGGMFDGRSREMKNLQKERAAIDCEWEEGGAMFVLVRTGVLGRASDGTTTKKIASANPAAAAAGSAVARLLARHGTPFKSQGVSTPMTSRSAGGVLSAVRHPPNGAGANSASAPISTPTVESKLPGSDFINSNHTITFKMSRSRPSTAPTHLSREEKENSVAATPIKLVGFSVNGTASPMSGSPLINLLARSSPLSAEKLKNTGDVLGEIISMFCDRFSPHERYLGIRALALFAKENPRDPCWDVKFPSVLSCLLGKYFVTSI